MGEIPVRSRGVRAACAFFSATQTRLIFSEPSTSSHTIFSGTSTRQGSGARSATASALPTHVIRPRSVSPQRGLSHVARRASVALLI